MKRQSVLIAGVSKSRLLADALRLSGREVTVAAEGQDLAQLALESRPDALILSIDAPQEAAMEAIRTLRGQGFDAPIVCTAAPGCEEAVLEAYRLGANDCLLTPLEDMQVCAAVDLVLPPTETGRATKARVQQLLRENDALRRQLGEMTAIS